jgi:glucose-6-phosphate 1-dehydrogenase
MTINPADPQAVVIFGATGDLMRRKLMPAFFHLFLENLLPEKFAIVGCSRTAMRDDDFKAQMLRSVEQFGRRTPSPEAWEKFSALLSYCSAGFDKEGDLAGLRDHLVGIDERLGTAGRRVYYCSTPAQAYPMIVRRLAECGMEKDARIIIEKPFGRDLASARELNDQLHAVFAEGQIFRIDHYLGKETVKNILAFRFSNGMFEPIWNRRYIDNVQITVAEEIGIEGRGAFFEKTGTLRDMLSTHLFQVLTFIAMEPPISFDPSRLRDEKARVLHSMSPVNVKKVIRGQFVGYRQEPGVAKDSQTETYAAVQLEIDNWRWAGVPFNLRTGKMLKRKVSEVSLSFRHVPYNIFKGANAGPPGRDALAFRIQPDEGISLHMNVKMPGTGLNLTRARLDFDYEKTFEAPLAEAYELLLLDAMKGDHTLFTREDEVERAWEVLQPVLEDPPRVRFYEPGSWGPDEADDLILPRHWHLTAGERSPGSEAGHAGAVTATEVVNTV